MVCLKGYSYFLHERAPGPLDLHPVDWRDPPVADGRTQLPLAREVPHHVAGTEDLGVQDGSPARRPTHDHEPPVQHHVLERPRRALYERPDAESSGSRCRDERHVRGRQRVVPVFRAGPWRRGCAPAHSRPAGLHGRLFPDVPRLRTVHERGGPQVWNPGAFPASA
eukprot:1997767-Rhodomonas_salina.2